MLPGPERPGLIGDRCRAQRAPGCRPRSLSRRDCSSGRTEEQISSENVAIFCFYNFDATFIIKWAIAGLFFLCFSLFNSKCMFGKKLPMTRFEPLVSEATALPTETQ